MKTKPSADAAYRDRIAKTRTMISALTVLLDHHEADQTRDSTNWGFVGDLGALNKKLGEAAICITPGR